MRREPDPSPTIRPATPDDASAIRECVRSAYALYRERMDREPAPVLADYDALIARNVVWVLDTQDGVHGIIVIFPEDDALFIENVAVYPAVQGRGYGQQLLKFAEAQAQAHGLATLRLYTNEVMTENLGFYARLGYVETERRLEDGYRRVFLEKRC